MSVVDSIGHSGLFTIGDLLRVRAGRSPELTAIEVHDGAADTRVALSYRELLASALTFANWLRSQGVTEGDRVQIVSETSRDLITAMYGAALSGAIMVPTNTAWTPTEIDTAIDAVQPKLVLVDQLQRVGDRLPRGDSGVGTEVLLLEEVAEVQPARAVEDRLALNITSRSPAQIVFTSGTTATPKGVTLSHANCLGGAAQAGATVGWGTGERFVSALPLFHVNAQTFCLWSALVWGGTAIFFKEFSAGAFPRQLQETRATVTSMVSTQVRTIIRQGSHEEAKPKALKHIVFAINISDEERESLEGAWSVQLRNGYGLSEAMTLVALEPSWQPHRLWPSVGLPAPGRRVRVVDESGADVAHGQVGELLVAGEMGLDLMLGYWGDSNATDEAIVNGWLHTGDLVRIGKAGEILYVGRRKDVIKVAGENVSAAGVEEVLLGHPSVVECVIFSLPDPVRDERVAAAVVVEEGGSETEIREYLAERLAPYKLPSVIRIVDELPRTNIGKIDKGAVRSSVMEWEEQG